MGIVIFIMNRLLLTIATLVCTSFTKEFSLEDFVPQHPIADNSTYGNIEQIHTTHFHLDLTVNFDERVFSGTVTHDLNVVADTNVLQFDAWDITVHGVNFAASGAARRMRE